MPESLPLEEGMHWQVIQRTQVPSYAMSTPCLQHGVGGDEGAVDVEDGFVEERRRLLLPDLEPGLIEDILEGLDVVGW